MDKKMIDLIEWKLNDIKKIADFQIDRIKNEKSVDKKRILNEALDFIRIDIGKIREILNNDADRL